MSDEDTQAKATPVNICEALIDPRIGWGTVPVDGREVCHLRIYHPRLGPIDCLLYQATARGLVAGISDALHVVTASDQQTSTAH